MKKSEWGPIIWNAIHLLCYKIKDTSFTIIKDEFIVMLTKICANLPCPSCSSHAQSLIKRYRLKFVKNKEEVNKIIFNMHNEVNKRTNKPLFKYTDLDKTYKDLNLKEALTKYYSTTLNMNLGERMMLHSFHKKKILNEFKIFINKNLIHFDD